MEKIAEIENIPYFLPVVYLKAHNKELLFIATIPYQQFWSKWNV